MKSAFEASLICSWQRRAVPNSLGLSSAFILLSILHHKGPSLHTTISLTPAPWAARSSDMCASSVVSLFSSEPPSRAIKPSNIFNFFNSLILLSFLYVIIRWLVFCWPAFLPSDSFSQPRGTVTWSAGQCEPQVQHSFTQPGALRLKWTTVLLLHSFVCPVYTHLHGNRAV